VTSASSSVRVQALKADGTIATILVTFIRNGASNRCQLYAQTFIGDAS
jgi:hypothetical protein